MTASGAMLSLRWIDTGFGSYNGRLADAPAGEVIAMRGGSSRAQWTWICAGRSGSANSADAAMAAAEAAFREWCKRAGLVRVVPDAPPVPGANPLDAPEVREALAAAIQDADGLDIGPRDAANAAADVIAALAPHIAALQRAVWQACVEAVAVALAGSTDEHRVAAAFREHGMDAPTATVLGEAVAGGVEAALEHVRGLPVPAEFAAPEPDTRAALVATLRALAADPATAGLCAADLAAEMEAKHV